jgi:hypothetical protein
MSVYLKRWVTIQFWSLAITFWSPKPVHRSVYNSEKWIANCLTFRGTVKYIGFYLQGAADSSNDAIRTFICTTICPASNQATVLQGTQPEKSREFYFEIH